MEGEGGVVGGWGGRGGREEEGGGVDGGAGEGGGEGGGVTGEEGREQRVRVEGWGAGGWERRGGGYVGGGRERGYVSGGDVGEWAVGIGWRREEGGERCCRGRTGRQLISGRWMKGWDDGGGVGAANVQVAVGEIHIISKRGGL